MNVTITRAGGMNVTIRTGGVQGPPGPASPKGFAIDWPTNTEAVTLMWTPYAFEIADMHAVVRGTSPAMTFVVKRGASRETAEAVVATGTAVGGVGLDVVVSEPVVAAGQYLWLETTGSTGIVEEFHLTMWF